MARERVHLNRAGKRKGQSNLPPEEEVWLDAFDIAIGDVLGESIRPDEVINRVESERWLLSQHAFWVGSMIWDVNHIIALQNWVRDGLPTPEIARKRKTVYYAVGEKF